MTTKKDDKKTATVPEPNATNPSIAELAAEQRALDEKIKKAQLGK